MLVECGDIETEGEGSEWYLQSLVYFLNIFNFFEFVKNIIFFFELTIMCFFFLSKKEAKNGY